ncbi:Hypothetical predicted protein [Podarcis lilfordi]|uniref:Uncharacterized protein n=1 Tax=Podarcis lilfordi TaxID=74358 RepID=A0AA35P4S4_9SAUR|nr:Hypothetical predicted protein [Podarcis lilfordi]
MEGLQPPPQPMLPEALKVERGARLLPEALKCNRLVGARTQLTRPTIETRRRRGPAGARSRRPRRNGEGSQRGPPRSEVTQARTFGSWATVFSTGRNGMLKHHPAWCCQSHTQ